MPNKKRERKLKELTIDAKGPSDSVQELIDNMHNITLTPWDIDEVFKDSNDSNDGCTIHALDLDFHFDRLTNNVVRAFRREKSVLSQYLDDASISAVSKLVWVTAQTIHQKEFEKHPKYSQLVYYKAYTLYQFYERRLSHILEVISVRNMQRIITVRRCVTQAILNVKRQYRVSPQKVVTEDLAWPGSQEDEEKQRLRRERAERERAERVERAEREQAEQAARQRVVRAQAVRAPQPAAQRDPIDQDRKKQSILRAHEHAQRERKKEEDRLNHLEWCSEMKQLAYKIQQGIS